MPRFYNPQRTEFIEDGIYQPPWELLMGVLQQKDQETQQLADEIEFARNVPVRFDPREQDIAEGIVQGYEEEIDEISRALAEDPSDVSVRERLLSAQRKIRQDFKFGDIKRLSDTKDNLEEFEEYLTENVQDEFWRERYREHYVDKGYFGDPDRTEAFSFDGELYDKKNLLDDMAGSPFFTQMSPDRIKNGFAYLADDGYMTQGYNSEAGLAAEDVKKAAIAYIESNVSEGYMRDAQDIMGEKWLDDEGNIDFSSPDSEPMKLIKAMAEAKSYKEVDSEVRKSGGPTEKDSAGRGNVVKENALASGLDENVANYYSLSDEGQRIADARYQAYNAFAVDVFKQMNKPNTNPTSREVQALLNTVRQNPNLYPGALEQLNNIDSIFNSRMTAGMGHLAGLPPEELANIQSKLASPNTAQDLLSKEGTIVYGGEVLNFFRGTTDTGVKASKPSDFLLQNFTLPSGEVVKITGVKGVAGSPRYMPATDYDYGTGQVKDGIKMRVELEYTQTKVVIPDGLTEEQASRADGTPVTTTGTFEVDFYIPDNPLDFNI